MGLLKFFSSSFFRGKHPHSGFVYPHSGCLCCKTEGEGLVNMGLLKLFSSSFFMGMSRTVGPCIFTEELSHTVVS